MRLSSLPCVPVCPHVATRNPLRGLSWNTTLGEFIHIYQPINILVKLNNNKGQEQEELHTILGEFLEWQSKYLFEREKCFQQKLWRKDKDKFSVQYTFLVTLTLFETIRVKWFLCSSVPPFSLFYAIYVQETLRNSHSWTQKLVTITESTRQNFSAVHTFPKRCLLQLLYRSLTHGIENVVLWNPLVMFTNSK
jgi:hypothetical protein